MGFAFAAVGAALALGIAAAVAVSGSGSNSSPPPAGQRVLRRELAAGVRGELLAFLDWWNANGPHAITLAYKTPQWSYIAPAGVRTDADQLQANLTGQSNATKAADSPHGRGAALDLWPTDFAPNVAWEQQPQSVRDKFKKLGELAESRGLVWGGRWSAFNAGKGDQPHVELPNWRNLPQPPKVA